MSICQKSFSISFMIKKKESCEIDLLFEKKTCKFDSLSISRTTIGICSTINCNTRISKSYAILLFIFLY